MEHLRGCSYNQLPEDDSVLQQDRQVGNQPGVKVKKKRKKKEAGIGCGRPSLL
jgi:hypothetical protein